VPLIALNRQLDLGKHQTAFLVPRIYHTALKSMGLSVLDIDYRQEHAFRNEMAACWNFRPDVMVDDFSMTALFTAKLAKKPRITILRTGAFPGASPRDATHRHSSESANGSRIDFSGTASSHAALAGLRAPKNFAEACAADIGIIPGIRSIEVLPEAARENPSFFFAGSLSIPDADIPMPGIDHAGAVASISTFMGRHEGTPAAFATLGSVLKTNEATHQAIRYMLDCGMAVVSTMDVPDLSASSRERFLYLPFVPMHEICARVDLMIHHCGSGTYQYAITHKVPAICIGSGCYDRDDVAHRLEQLGVAKYIPHTLNVDAFAEKFRETFDECMSAGSSWHAMATKRLQLLKDEVDQTTARFDFESLLKRAAASCLVPA